MKNIFAVFVVALLTLTLLHCNNVSEPPALHERVYNHFFTVGNARSFNRIHMYEKTYYMLTALPTNPAGALMTLNFVLHVPPDSSLTVGFLRLPNDGYYTLKVYATDGSYLKWDNYYMARNSKTSFWIILYPDCKNWGSTTGYMSMATEMYYSPESNRNTGYHIRDGLLWCDLNP